VLASLWILGLGSGVPAIALDRSRTLTQAMHRIWQTPQGLPQATIYAICQTQDGFLWLGTHSALVRFDGIRFTTQHLHDNLALNRCWINDLAEDAHQNLWIATEGVGLARLRAGEVRSYTTADGLPSDDVEWVRVDREGGVWAGTKAGVARLGETLQVYRCGDAIATNRARVGGIDADGRLCVGGDGNVLSVWDGSRFTSREVRSLPANVMIQCLLDAANKSLWVGSNAGLVRLDGPNEQRLTTAEGLASDNVLCLNRAGATGVWAGTRDGFSRIEPKSDPAAHAYDIESYRSRDGLSQSTVYALCEDREGSLWVGTKHGLNQFCDRRTLIYTTSEGLPSDDIGPVLGDSTGQIWVGALGAGVGRFDGRRFSRMTTADNLASNTILSLAEHGGALWIGSDQGLTRLDQGVVQKTLTQADGLPSNNVASLVVDRAGTLWIGTSAGLACWRDGEIRRPRGDQETLDQPIAALSRHGDGVLAATSQGALLRCDDDQLAWFDREDPLCRDVTTIYEDPQGRIWLGERSTGLVLIEPEQSAPAASAQAAADKPADAGARKRSATGKRVPITMKDGLIDDEISGLIADDRGQLWMACSRGIAASPIANLLDFAAGQVESISCRPFTPTDAQRTIECQTGVQPSLCRAPDGRIWFSTIRGLMVIDPGRLVRTLPPMPVVVEQMSVNGVVEDLNAIAPLAPGRTNVSFQYAALTFISPTRMTYRYKLEGYDARWVDAGTRREAFYTNLPPGDYTFRVAAKNVDGTEIACQSPVSFTIDTFIYQRWWFWPLMIGAVLGLGVGAAWAGLRIRVRRMRHSMQAVVAERSRIARELHDTLMQGFSGVTMEMQALSVRLSPSAERATLEEIIRDAGVCLREARRSVAGLRAGGTTGLAATIAEAAQQLTETQAVRLRLQLDPTPQVLPPDAQYNLLRIAQEAIANAVKHADCSAIDVSLACSSKRLELTIADDGVGFAAQDDRTPGHYGVIGMQERANQIGADLRLDSSPGRGTRVSVTMPIHQTAREPAPSGAPL
jgi:signal transduction histidine kinase/ligand-binding sensor domain-containing protein